MATIANAMAHDIRTLNNIMNRMFIGADHSVISTKQQNFPCYNIIQEMDAENNPIYVRIEFALAGYTVEQLEVIVENSKLYVRTKDKFKELNVVDNATTTSTILHQGITNRKFEITFPLAPQLSDAPDVTFKDGILKVNFKYEKHTRKSIPILTSN